MVEGVSLYFFCTPLLHSAHARSARSGSVQSLKATLPLCFAPVRAVSAQEQAQALTAPSIATGIL